MGRPIETQLKDGVAWPVGGQEEVDWITEGTENGRRITAAIPPLFAGCATLTNRQGAPDLPREPGVPGLPREPGVPGLPRDVGLERRQDMAFVDVLAWRLALGAQPNWKSTELPEVMFPEDRSWLVSFLWDDDRACIGGSEAHIRELLNDPGLAPNVRRVDTQQDATRPGD